jgi:hypothetical protein
MATETPEASSSTASVDVAALPVVPQALPGPDQELGTERRGQRPRACDEPVEPAVCAPHVALMPDTQAGYGMPIGGVLFADRAVVPSAIGVDIGCGVALVRDRPDGRDAVGGRARRYARGDRRGRAGRDERPAEPGRSRRRAYESRKGRLGRAGVKNERMTHDD